MQISMNSDYYSSMAIHLILHVKHMSGKSVHIVQSFNGTFGNITTGYGNIDFSNYSNSDVEENLVWVPIKKSESLDYLWDVCSEDEVEDYAVESYMGDVMHRSLRDYITGYLSDKTKIPPLYSFSTRVQKMMKTGKDLPLPDIRYKPIPMNLSGFEWVPVKECAPGSNNVIWTLIPKGELKQKTTTRMDDRTVRAIVDHNRGGKFDMIAVESILTLSPRVVAFMEAGLTLPWSTDKCKDMVWMPKKKHGEWKWTVTNRSNVDAYTYSLDDLPLYDSDSPLWGFVEQYNRNRQVYSLKEHLTNSVIRLMDNDIRLPDPPSLCERLRWMIDLKWTMSRDSTYRVRLCQGESDCYLEMDVCNILDSEYRAHSNRKDVYLYDLHLHNKISKEKVDFMPLLPPYRVWRLDVNEPSGQDPLYLTLNYVASYEPQRDIPQVVTYSYTHWNKELPESPLGHSIKSVNKRLLDGDEWMVDVGISTETIWNAIREYNKKSLLYSEFKNRIAPVEISHTVVSVLSAGTKLPDPPK